jgi:hypothetical protein
MGMNSLKNIKFGYFFLCLIPCLLFLIFAWNATDLTLSSYGNSGSFPLVVIIISAIVLSLEDLLVLFLFPRSRDKPSNNLRELVLLTGILSLSGFLINLDGFPDAPSIAYILSLTFYWMIFSNLHQAIQSRVPFRQFLEPILSKANETIDVGQDWKRKEALEQHYYEIEAHRIRLKRAHSISSFLLVLGLIFSIILYTAPFSVPIFHMVLGIISLFFLIILRIFTLQSGEDHLYIPHDLIPNETLHSRRSGISILVLVVTGILAIIINSDNSIVSESQLSQFISWLLALFSFDSESSNSAYEQFNESLQRQTQSTELDQFVPMEWTNPISELWAEIVQTLFVSIIAALVLWFLLAPLLEPGSLRLLLKDLKQIKGFWKKLGKILHFFISKLKSPFFRPLSISPQISQSSQQLSN